MTDVPGKDSAGLLNECIFMTVSGPNIQTWSVSVSYRREGSELIFEGPIESQHDILNLARMDAESDAALTDNWVSVLVPILMSTK